MNIKNLDTMTDFVLGVLDYTHESNDCERGIDLIRWYSELLKQPLKVDMFVGMNALFPNFELVSSSSHAMKNSYKNAFCVSIKDEFEVTLYRKSKHSTSKNGMCYIASYHLNKVEDLCGRDIEFNMDSEYAESEIELY